MNTFDKGDVVRVKGVWRDADGTETDPQSGALTFRYKIGSGSTTILTYPTDAAVVKDAVGQYHVDLTIASDNTLYYWRWASTGTVTAADEGQFFIRKTNF